jgi:hypothetical protein
MFVTHDTGRSISVAVGANEPPVATLDYASAPKPFLHPVTTPSGASMTLVEPFDHLWHRGLWFTFKFVNGDNFWEERDDFGRQHVADIPRVSHPDPATTAIDLDLDWVMSGQDAPIIVERRRLTIAVTDDATQIDLATTLRPATDVTLDRTPYTTWGGYGGVAFRGTPLWHPSQRTVGDQVTDGFLTGETALWCDVSGPIDGGADRSAGVAILDHPANPRHPTPWYTGSGAGNFLNAALLFHGPLTLAAGETLALRYRILVHDGMWGVVDVRRQFERYATGS